MSKKTSNDAPLHSTKQMLDELDALMERMLTLPVNDLDNAPQLPSEPPPALKATLSYVEPSAPPQKLEKPAPLTPSVKPPRKSKLAKYLAESKAQKEIEDLPAPVHARTNPPHRPLPAYEATPESLESDPEPLTNDITPESLLSRLEPLLADIPDARPKVKTDWAYRSLVRLNQLFDSTMNLFGGAGDWLRGAAGRMLLGGAGLVLIVVSAGWLMKDLLGWHW